MTDAEAAMLPPLEVVYSDRGEAELYDGYQWLAHFGFEVAERWLGGIQREAQIEAERLSGQGALRRPLAPNRPLGMNRYRVLYRTGGRNSSAWFIDYELRDLDADGVHDTLYVVGVYHARSARASGGADATEEL